jgi:tetratricopeptide (TPR) repeat protein
LQAASVSVVSMACIGTASAAGEQEWAFETGADVNSSPTVVDGTVFVGSDDGNLYAVDAATGEQQWAFETGDSVWSSPTVVDGTVFVGRGDNNLYAVDAASGEEEWVFETDDWVFSSPTVVDGTVFVGSHDDNVYALDARDGTEQWRFETGAEVASSPTVVDGTVFVGSADDNLYAVNAVNGFPVLPVTVGALTLGSAAAVAWLKRHRSGRDSTESPQVERRDPTSKPTPGSTDITHGRGAARTASEERRERLVKQVQTHLETAQNHIEDGDLADATEQYGNAQYTLDEIETTSSDFTTETNIEDLQQQIADGFENVAHSLKTEGEDHFAADRYDDAREAFAQGREVTTEAQSLLPAGAEFPADLIEELTVQSWREKLVEQVQTHLETAQNHVEDGDLADATEQYGSAQSALDEIETTSSDLTTEANVEDLQDEIADGFKGVADSLKNDGEDHLEAERYNDAHEAFEQAREVSREAQSLLPAAAEFPADLVDELTVQSFTARVNNALEATEEKSLEERQEEVQEIIDDIEQVDSDRERELEVIRREAVRGLVQSRISEGERRFADAETAYLDDSFETASDGFEATKDFFADVKATAEEHGLRDAEDSIDEWLVACEENADAASRAALGVGAGRPEITTMSELRGEAEAEPEDTVQFDQAQRAPASPGSHVEDKLQAELPAHEVLDHVGSGGNADVHKVRLEETGEIQALKVPQWQGTLSQQDVEDFIDEAQTWDRLDDHEHIIDIEDYGTKPYPWMLLEFMERGNMTEWEQTAPAQGLDWLVDVCKATDHAHQHGIAHTDLKPENIMFTEQAGTEVVKVGDWGLAQVMLEHSKSIEGMTPSYAAPEQIDPETYGGTDPQTDIYEIGVIAYEVLTGEVPYDYGSTAAVMNAIVTKEPTAPSDVAPELPAAVDDVLLEALATEPDDRYESVLYLRDDLQDLLDNLT